MGGIRQGARGAPPMKCQQSIDDPLSITRCPKNSYINPTNETAALPTWLWSPGEPRPARPPTATSAHPRTSSPAECRRTRPTHRGSESPRRSPRWRQPAPRLKQKNDVSPIARTMIKINSPLQAAIAPLADLLPSASSNLAASNVASLAPSNRTRILPRFEAPTRSSTAADRTPPAPVG